MLLWMGILSFVLILIFIATTPSLLDMLIVLIIVGISFYWKHVVRNLLWPLFRLTLTTPTLMLILMLITATPSFLNMFIVIVIVYISIDREHVVRNMLDFLFRLYLALDLTLALGPMTATQGGIALMVVVPVA
jgi:hypothetical protein